MSPEDRRADRQSWAQVLSEAAGRLGQCGIPDPLRDAKKLLGHALGHSQAHVTLHLAEAPDPDTAAHFFDLLNRRLAREPVARILGRRDFWRHSFRIGPDVLDPRPETETLVEIALSEPFDRVLDLGTGSGCILLSLLADRPEATGVGADISTRALAVARANAVALKLADRVELQLSDWYSGVQGGFDLIVSNPPYIAADALADLSPEVRDHDPRIALTDGGDGLGAYRAIAAGAPAHLIQGGRLIVEIGPDQAPAVAALFEGAGLEKAAVHADLDGRPRVVTARNPG